MLIKPPTPSPQDDNNRGYTPFEEETLDPGHQSKVRSQEFLITKQLVPGAQGSALQWHHVPGRCNGKAAGAVELAQTLNCTKHGQPTELYRVIQRRATTLAARSPAVAQRRRCPSTAPTSGRRPRCCQTSVPPLMITSPLFPDWAAACCG